MNTFQNAIQAYQNNINQKQIINQEKTMNQKNEITNQPAANANAQMNEPEKTAFWKDFVRRSRSAILAEVLLDFFPHDTGRDGMCQALQIIQEEDREQLEGLSGPLSEIEMVAIAALKLGIEYWYARYWYLEMASNGWRTSGGIQINAANWRRLMQKWWAHAYPEIKNDIHEKYKIMRNNPPPNTKS